MKLHYLVINRRKKIRKSFLYKYVLDEKFKIICWRKIIDRYD